MEEKTDNVWGILLILGGILTIILSFSNTETYLYLVLGLNTLAIGVISVIFRKRWTLLMIALQVCIVGLINILTSSWILGLIQLVMGMVVFNEYKKSNKEVSKNDIKKEFKNNVYGIAGLITSIMSIFPGLLFTYTGLMLSILSIIFSVGQRKNNNTRMATAGMVIGIIGLIINVLFIFYGLIAILILGQI